MKKYISALLIDTFLLMLSGCYSQQSMTYDEFYNSHNRNDAVIVTKDDNSIKLISDSTDSKYMTWNAEPDTLKIYIFNKTTENENQANSEIDTLNLTKDDIAEVFTEQYDEIATYIAVGIPIVIIILFRVFLRADGGFSVGGF